MMIWNGLWGVLLWELGAENMDRRSGLWTIYYEDDILCSRSRCNYNGQLFIVHLTCCHLYSIGLAAS